MDRAGNLLVGTESPGKVIRVDSDGKGFVLLDTPYQEIRGLRFDDKGQLYAAALNGRPGGGAAPAPSIGTDQPLDTGRAPVPSVSVSTEITAIAIVDGAGSSSTSSSSRDDRRASKGARLPHHARRPVGHDLGLPRGRAVRRRVRPDGRAHHRHGQQGQAVPPRRRPAPADAAHARQRAAGHGVLRRPARPAVLRDGQSRKAVPAVVRARARAAPTSPSRATRRCWRPGER